MNVIKIGNIYGATGGNFAGNIYDIEGLCPSINTCGGGNREPIILKDMETNNKKKYSIRKLTPKECFRLMDFDDKDFEAAESVNANTNLYKQAGNSIVVGCLSAVFSQLHIQDKKTWNEMTLDERYELTKINKKDI